MKKNINLSAISLLFKVWLLTVDKKELFGKIPVSKSGPEYLFEEFSQDFDAGKLALTDIFEKRFNQKLPEVDIPDPIEPEPEPSKDEYKFLKKYDGLRPVAGKQFTWLLNIRLKGTIKFVWPECNQELIVPNADITHGADGNRDNHWQAFYFTKEDHEEHNFAASIFAKPGCKATYVEVWQKL